MAGGILALLCSSCNAIHVRFLNNDDNVAFYIEMQDIDRIMDINNCKPINTNLYQIHLFTIIAVSGMTVLIFIITLFTHNALIFGFLALSSSYGNFLLEMVYCSNLIAYFYLRVRFINTIMESHVHAQTIKVYTTPNSNIKLLDLQSQNFVTSDTDVYVERIFKCFLKYQDMYRFQVNLNYVIPTYI